MKTKIFVIAVLLQYAFNIYSQDLNKKTTDSVSGKEILIGLCDLNGFKTVEFIDSYINEYELYKVNTLILEKIDSLLKLKENENIRIKIVLGTWCGDSKEQVPRFVKILNIINFNSGKIEFVCVDRKKKAGDVQIADLKIEKVPTFIIYNNAKEIGRIIETPVKTLEEDLLKILRSPVTGH
ncbi:MAG: thioredoxin family protein [Bacteroidales bacterium]|nr:thioredoxin family protein [Bacteroidales bacterium]